MKRLTLVALPGDEGERLDRFIAARGGISRGLARRTIDTGGVFLDGRRCKVSGKLLRAGYEITVNLEEGGRAPAAAGGLDRSRLLFAEVDRKKIGRTIRGASVISYEAVERVRGRPLLVAVGAPGARDLIRAELAKRGFEEGREFRCVA